MTSIDPIKSNDTVTANDSNVSKNPPESCRLIVHTQYIKDFSFESPNAPKCFIENIGKPDIEVSVNVSAKLYDDDKYEVVLNLGAKAMAGNTVMFLVELAYAGLVSPQGGQADEVNAHVMIETPSLLFPFARAIIANATRDGGFIPLNIQPVDFVAIYGLDVAKRAATKGKDN